jgi:hypothetical protein
MIRNLKSLGLALVAVLAMSAVVASAAHAVPQYTASSYSATATGANNKGGETFTTSGGTVTCDSHFQGTLSAASSTLTVTPNYSNCEAFGFLSADVHENGCTYVFHATSKLSTDHYSSSVDIVCPAGKTMVITASACEVSVGAQNGLSSVTTQNLAGGQVTVVPNVGNITMNVTKDGFGCPFSSTGHTKGTYHGDVVISSKTAEIAVSGS